MSDGPVVDFEFLAGLTESAFGMVKAGLELDLEAHEASEDDVVLKIERTAHLSAATEGSEVRIHLKISLHDSTGAS